MKLVIVMPPIDLSDLDADDIRRSSKIATERLMDAIYTLEKTL